MPTTTAQVIITDALKEIQVVAENETPTTTMLADGLRMINRLLDTFSNDRNFAYFPSLLSIALTGQASFTIGTTGDIVADRPIEINTAYVDRSGVSYPVKVIDNERYDRITYKLLAGANTQAIYYEATYPLGLVYPYPIATGCTLYMRVLNSVKQFAALSTNIDMPPGYEDYIMLGLAIRWAPQFGKTVSPDTKMAYHRASKNVKQNNLVVPTMSLPVAVQSGNRGSYSDYLSGNI
jgi:hypothetical protein